MDAPVGTVIAYATSPGSVAADGRDRNGLYTKHLLRTIDQPGLSVPQMFNQVGLEVMRETKRKQVPWVSNTPIEPVYLAGRLSPSNGVNQAVEAGLERGNITIFSNPSGVTVYIDGKRVGVTPVELTDILPGKKTIRMEKAGYATEETQITFRKGSRTVLRFTLMEVKKDLVAQSRDFTEPKTNMDFVHISGGCFQMESTDGKSDEKPAHEVCVDDFYMGKYEVTVGQWRKFIRDTSYKTEAEKNSAGWVGCYSYKKGDDKKWRDGRDWNNPGFFQSASQPVVCVSYNDVTAFIRWLNRQDGNRYRLPTEAEWEYAARGRTSSSRYWGDDPGATCSFANVQDKRSHDGLKWTNGFDCNDGYFFSAPVGRLKANKFGLYDMLGNVYEWCSDIYDPVYFSVTPRNKPQGLSPGSLRVIRGGSWRSSNPAEVSAAFHVRLKSAYRSDALGFRLVSPGQ